MQNYFVLTLLGGLSFFMISCSKTDDTKPMVDVTSPASGVNYLTDDSIDFQAIFSDNEALGQYRVELKNNFGGQQTALTPWQAVFVYDIEGSEQTVQKYFPVPDTIPAGWYLVMVKATDAEGNEAYTDTTPIYIQNAGDVVSPVIDIASPVDSAVYLSSDTLILSILISDNLKLYQFSVNVSNDSVTIHSETKDHPSNPYDFYLTINDLDSLSGWYKLNVTASDSMNNTVFAERKFLIQ